MEEEVIMIPLHKNKQTHKCALMVIITSHAHPFGSIKQVGADCCTGWYLPGGSEDGQAHGETDADVRPGVGADAVEHVFPALVVAIEASGREVIFNCA